jgi:hypothetical protein|tara:strand:- start:4362 stop:4820 length:459 start_codon:yes stop_codon:yes gene_type:complete
MARQIRIDQIADLMEEEIEQVVKVAAFELEKEVKEQTPVFSLSNYSQSELDSMPMFFTVRGKTVPFKKALLEHGTGGTLRGAWQTNLGKFRAEITNNMDYAEPVLYGNNLPPGWGGKYRTRQGTIPGFPDLIVKEIATNRVPRIVEAFRRRN